MRIAGVAVIVTATVALFSAARDSVDDYVRSQLGVRKLPGLSLAVIQNGRYRSTTSAGRRYLTVRLSEAGAILGVLIEE